MSLSRLWERFEQKLGAWCLHQAVVAYGTKSFQPKDAFGTALDLCEDIFLRALDDYDLQLVPVSGAVISIAPKIPKSAARLLDKLAVLESSIVAIYPDEAGPDGEWLQRMGSSIFRRAENMTCWPDHKLPGSSPVWIDRLGARAFHTLPILFERPAFVIARDLPPWANDLIEDSFVRNVWSHVAGSSICLTAEDGARFGKENAPSRALPILQGLIPSVDFNVDNTSNAKVGRPRVLDDVIEAYLALGLLGRDLSWKAKQAEVGDMLGRFVSETTLRRAERYLRSKTDIS